ncbi:MAG: hypothetical protein C4338_07070 [Rhodanobacteraceae bacterium]
MNFKDHFSGQADLYARARPHYPAALFEWIAAQSPARECAWDVACGNGQASAALQSDPRIEYRVESAEHGSLADHSVDAITVTQALHWFDLTRFIDEVRRVAEPGTLFAAWSYANCNVDAQVDAVIAHLYDGILGEYLAARAAAGG